MEQRTEGPRPARPLVTGIDHAGITVSSLDRSLAFYRDLLGLRVIEISGEEEIGAIVGIDNARIKAADLDAGDGRIIELLEYIGAGNEPVPQRPDGVGCPHIALRVTDLTEALARLAEAGHQPIGQRATITGAIAWEGATVVYLRDPDGALIELIQRPGAR